MTVATTVEPSYTLYEAAGSLLLVSVQFRFDARSWRRPARSALSAPPGPACVAVCGPSVDRVKSANSSVVVFVGLQHRSCPPWKVEKNTPEWAPGSGSVTWQTFLPSLQTVIEPVETFVSCSIECHLPSAGKVQFPRHRSAPNPEPDAV